MKLDLKVIYDDGREVVAHAKPRDVIEFERRYQIPYAALGSATTAREEWWYFLAWSPLHRTGQEPRDFDVFTESISGIEINPEEADAPVPFETVPSDGSSLNSPPPE